MKERSMCEMTKLESLTKIHKKSNDRTQLCYYSSKSRELPKPSSDSEIHAPLCPIVHPKSCVNCEDGLLPCDNYYSKVDNGVHTSFVEANICPCRWFSPAVPSTSHSPFLTNHKFDSSWASITTQKCLNITNKTLSKYFEVSSSFHRFMARFSGRRRLGKSVHKIITSYTILVLVLSILLKRAEGCSSRSTPKPRPPSPTMRPNITFQTYACPPAYSAWYCLNGATCFTVKIGEALLYNCECADGYMGRRCEFKDLDGSYLPSREKVMLETASIAGGATIAVVLVFVVSIALYIYLDRRRKEQQYLRYMPDLPDGPVLQMTVELSSEDLECRPFSNIVRSHGISLAPITHSNFSTVEKKPIRFVGSASLAINHNHSVYHQDSPP